jgi:hypothetical protein
MQQIRKEQKLGKEATLQGCRRTFISMAMDRGISAEMVASIAGNSVAVIEKHYKDLRTMNAQSAVDKMDLSGLLETADPSSNSSAQSGKSDLASIGVENHSKNHSKDKDSNPQVLTP